MVPSIDLINLRIVSQLGVKDMGTSSPRVTIIGLNFSPEPTGIAPYTTGLAEGLQGLDWSVRVVTAYPHYPAWRIAEGYPGLTMHDDVSGIPVTRLRPYLPRNPSGLKRLLVELSFGIRSIFASWGSPDVVVLISPALFAAAIALLRAKLSRRRPQVILWVQDLYSVGVAETGELGGFGARIMTKVEALILRGSDRVVAIHERFAQHMVARLHVPSSDIEVVRNWTHLDIAALDASEYRHKFGWGNEVVVLHAGNMGAKQALENVIDAARIADSENVPIRFVLLGNGNQRDNLQILGAGITRLDFMESLEDIDFQGAMAAADILLVNEKRGVTEMAVPSKLTSYFAAGQMWARSLLKR
jgi:colanic acid biosynthesis glycosyl transferase WcaI